MKVVGFLLLLAGWFLVLAALELLRSPGALAAFVVTGFAIEVLGLGLVLRANVEQAEVES